MTRDHLFVDMERRFALVVDHESGRSFVAIPVENTTTQYDEYYEVDPSTFEQFTADPTTAHDFVDKAKRRGLDHLLLFAPGTDRGDPN